MFDDKDYNSENNITDEKNSCPPPCDVDETENPSDENFDSDENSSATQESVPEKTISEAQENVDGASDFAEPKGETPFPNSGPNGSIYSNYSMYNNVQGPQYTQGDPNSVVTPPKKGNIVFWIITVVMLIVCIVVASVLVKQFGTGHGSTEDSLPSHEYTQTVIEHIKIEKPEKTYTDKTELYEKAKESCVTVICVIKGTSYGQTSQYASLGSGFVISKDGYIVTNAHVVEGASSIKIRFYDGTEKDALLIGKDTVCDIAVVKIHRSDDLVPVSFGDSSDVRVGDFAMAIGTPSNGDLFGSMTFGVISGKERRLAVKNSAGQIVKTMFFLQTDATLNPGNSGGPLFNMSGQVIGINTMKLSEDYEGIGFAIPSSGAIKIINSLISTGESDYSDSDYVKRGSQLGITGVSMDDSVEKKYGFEDDSPKGVLVLTIDKKSSAYKAGISTYDIIREFNGVEITTIEQLISEIQKCSPGEMVTVKVYRVERNDKDGKNYTYTFALDEVEE